MKYLVSIILIGVAIFVTLFYTKPAMDGSSALSAEKDTLSKQLASSRQSQNIIDEKATVYKSFSFEEISQIEKLLPNNIDNVKLIMDMDEIAASHGLKIRNMDLKLEEIADQNVRQEAQNPYGTAKLSFSVTSPYDRFVSFFGDLEDSLRLVDISSLSFSAGDKDLYEFNFEIKTYWLKSQI